MKTYGGTFRGNCPLEAQDQAAFVGHIRTLYSKTYGITIVHIKNEGRKTFAQAAYDKKNGQTKGASDIMIPGSPSFICELKRKDKTKSRLTDDQKSYLEAAAHQGAFACVAYGYDAALEAFRDWTWAKGQ